MAYQLYEPFTITAMLSLYSDIPLAKCSLISKFAMGLWQWLKISSKDPKCELNPVTTMKSQTVIH